MNPLEVDITSFYAKENAKKDHHTDLYDLVKKDTPTAILRRGENFSLVVRFKRSYDANRDVVRIVFTFGSNPRLTSGTKAVVIARLKPSEGNFPKDPMKWEAQITNNRKREDIVVEVHIPPDVPVGAWRCSVQTNIHKHRENTINYEVPDNIYILFNPWSPKDAVYMENEEMRNEYILNESGKIWCGTFKNPQGIPWEFDQFSDIGLYGSIFLLDKSNLPPSKRGDPVLVARAISAIVNSDDDDGLLVARFDGNYRDGRRPYSWANSTDILEEYMAEGKPVKYGQCWVYSAVIVTVCRAIGIPCRSTTNYVSAHDTDNPFIGRYLDSPDNADKFNDLCWCFHAWNDVWMTRPDLPPGYDGWQIIDGTPLTQTDKLKRCGPAPINAIKNGEIGIVYESSVLFCEVNADIVHFTADDDYDTGYKRITTNKYRVGRKIVTKKLGPADHNDPLDITAEYKYPPGSKEEYEAVSKAIRKIPDDIQPQPKKQKQDVIFDLADTPSVPYGTGFDVVVTVRNNAREDRSITFALSVSSIYYTGKVSKYILNPIPTKFKIKPGQEEVLRIIVPPEKYLGMLVDHGFIKLLASAKVEETGQVWSDEEDYILRAPDMSIAVSPGVSKVGHSCTVTFSFRNPLDEPLTDCIYTVVGPTKERAKTVRFRDVKPREMVNIPEIIVVNRKGKRKVITNFTSRQIPYITASTDIRVD